MTDQTQLKYAAGGNADQTEERMTQTAPWPTELSKLVYKCKVDPGWRIWLEHMDRGQGSVGLTLVIATETFDTYHPDRGRTYNVHHFFPVPPAAYDRRSWRRWLFERYQDVLSHEGCEMFQIDGERPYAPSHGPGNDPYFGLGRRPAEDQRTSFRGELRAE